MDRPDNRDDRFLPNKVFFDRRPNGSVRAQADLWHRCLRLRALLRHSHCRSNYCLRAGFAGGFGQTTSRTGIHFVGRDPYPGIYTRSLSGSSFFYRTIALALVSAVSRCSFYRRGRLRARHAQNHGGRGPISAPNFLRIALGLSARPLCFGLVAGGNSLAILCEQRSHHRACGGGHRSRLCDGAGARNFTRPGGTSFHRIASAGFSRHG